LNAEQKIEKEEIGILNKIIKVKIGKPLPYQRFDNSSSVLAWEKSVFSYVNLLENNKSENNI